MVFQGFLVALVASLIYMESRIGGQHMFDRPIIIGPAVGLIMGDVQTGLIIGGELELVWMGLVGIGTSTPPDMVVGSALATSIAIQTGAGYETTLALAIPISLVAQIGSIGVCILNTVFAHRADKCAENEDYKGVEVSHWMGSLVYFLFKFTVIFVGYLVGSEIITAFVDKIPTIIQAGLSTGSKLLPALGIAMLVQLTWDKKYGVFFFVGFGLASFLGVSTMGIAFFGTCLAVAYYMLSGNNKNVSKPATESILDDGDEEL